MFVQFLMDGSVDEKNRKRLLDYMRVAIRDGKGDSSNTFDDVFGVEIEDLEGPFEDWLSAKGGVAKRRRRR